MSRRRQLLLNAASVVCSVVALLVALELTYRERDRRANVSAPRGLYRLDPVFGLEVKPGLDQHELVLNDGKERFRVSTTARSHRGSARQRLERPPGVIRIMTDGLSYTFGWNMEDGQTWPAVLERLLNEARVFDARVEVINIGSPIIGGQPARYAARFRDYRPDVLIVETQPRWPQARGGTDPPPPLDPNPWFVDQVGIAHKHASANPLLRRLSESSVAVRHVLHRLVSQRSAAGGSTPAQARYEQQSDECLNYFRDYQAALTSDQALLFALIRPARASQPLDAILVKKLGALGVPAVSTATKIQFIPAHRGWDGHWSEEGNRLAARLVLELVRKNAGPIRAAVERRREAGLIR